MSSLCCSNCGTKYSIFNPEEGCSNCAFSFCRKCLPYRAVLPQLAKKPVSVCSKCYEKLNQEGLRDRSSNNAQITRISIGDVSEPHHVAGVTSSTNWWGDGLPPPSMRNTINRSLPLPERLHGISEKHARKVEGSANDTSDLEARLLRSRGNDVPRNVLTVSEIEERLATLRGCDVELIRRPHCIFETAEKPRLVGDTVQDLMKEAKDLVEVNERHDPINELERRHKRLREESEQQSDSAKTLVEEESNSAANGLGTDVENRPLSKESSATAFSEATAKELEDINKLMEDAQRRVNANEADEKHMENEMKSLLAAARQKSLELEEVNREIGEFWDARLNKAPVDISESDDESVDDETVKKIILEAEQAAEEIPSDKPSTSTLTPSDLKSSSHKKTGLFSKIFRK